MGKFILNEAREASFKLLEGEVKPGVLASVEGIGAWCDESTNGREYTESLFEKAFNHPTYAYEMAHGGVLGEADHPKGRDDTVYSEASHIVRKSWVENGEVHLIIDILNTPKGQVLYTILRAGKPLGISLRALGEYDKTKPGRKIVEDSFELITWDFVTNPGFTDARFAIAESVEREGRMSIEESVGRMIDSIGSMSENELKTLEEINKVYDFGDKKEVIEEAIDRKRKSLSAPTNIVRGLNMKVERLEAEATKKDKELEALREENERLVQGAEEGRKRIQELTEANQALETRVQIAESKSRNDGSKLVSLVQENLQKASTIKELRCASTESIVESKSRIEALSAELEESNKELTRQRESIAEERERSKKQVQETEESHRKEMKALLEAFGLEGPAVKRILESKNRKGQLVKELTEVEAVQEPTFKPVKVQESKTRSEANQRTSTLLNRIN